jgi:hypothetical protein
VDNVDKGKFSDLPALRSSSPYSVIIPTSLSRLLSQLRQGHPSCGQDRPKAVEILSF